MLLDYFISEYDLVIDRIEYLREQLQNDNSAVLNAVLEKQLMILTDYHNNLSKTVAVLRSEN